MSEDITPTHDAAKAATLAAFKGKIDDGEVNDFLEKIVGSAVPPPIGATGSLTFFAFWGVCKCDPPNYDWIFDNQVWGIGGAAISAVGLMYTAYESWDTFFRETTGFHVQGIAEGGGIYQINWFNGGTPIGQFNGAAGGISVFEAGANGKWKRK